MSDKAYQNLCTNLLYAPGDPAPQVILLTSPGVGEGKSTICANLGVTLAKMGKSTLILDCNLRRPAMYEICKASAVQGLTDILQGYCDDREVLQETRSGLQLITAGTVASDPSEVLSSRRFEDLLAWTRASFDYVLLDAPPVEPSTESMILADRSDGVLLVVDASQTRKSALQQSLRYLEAVEANVLGTVTNNAGNNA